MPETLPMFPLGSPLLPGAGLPLQVFEPRYHDMMEGVLAGDGRFGVVLITRGHEVGGGDQRVDVGTIADVVGHEHTDDGRRLVLAVGGARIRVVRWLQDDPYPRAEVEPWPDEADPDEGPVQGEATPRELRAALQARMDALVAVVADHVEDRERLAAAARLPDDLDAATWQSALVADLGPLDRQRLLEAPGLRERLGVLDRLLQERLDVLAFTLGGRDP